MDWQTWGMLSGAGLLGVTAFLAAAAVIGTKRRSCAAQTWVTNRQLTFRRQSATALQWARAAKPIFRAWSGERSLRVAAIVDEALGCKSFYLVAADGGTLPQFEPGQYLTFALPTRPHHQPLVRCYSLSDRPRSDYYRVTVKLQEPPAADPCLPPGQGSSYFHRQVRVGSTLAVQAPQGAFFLDPTDQLPVVLVGAGIGITPILSMTNSILHQQNRRQVYLFAGFRNSREQPFRQSLAEMATSDSFHVDISYSQPLPDDLLARDFHHHGHVSIVRLRQILPSSNFRFYVCGPAGMMERLIPGLRSWGVPESHLHFEAFGPASIPRPAATNGASHAPGPCRVTFSRSNAELDWQGDYTSLLDLAESAGVVLDSGCRAGSCGQCKLSVREGSVHHGKSPGVPLAARECLPCIGVPKGDVVLEG